MFISILFSCCPWISTSSSPTSRSIAAVAARPFIRALLFPSEVISRISTSSPSSAEKPSSESLSLTRSEISSNSAEITAFGAPLRTISFVVLPPRTAFIPPIITLLPAPVSPVNALKFAPSSTDAFSITARFSIESSRNKRHSPYLVIIFLSSSSSCTAWFSVRVSTNIVSSPAIVPTTKPKSCSSSTTQAAFASPGRHFITTVFMA